MKADIQELLELSDSAQIMEKLFGLKNDYFKNVVSILAEDENLASKALEWQKELLSDWLGYAFNDPLGNLPENCDFVEFAAIAVNLSGDEQILGFLSSLEQHWNDGDKPEKCIEVRVRLLERVVSRITTTDSKVSAKLRDLIISAYQPDMFNMIRKVEDGFRKVLKSFYSNREVNEHTDLSVYLTGVYFQDRFSQNSYEIFKAYLPYLNTKTIDDLVWDDTKGVAFIDMAEAANSDFVFEICNLIFSRNEDSQLPGLSKLLRNYGQVVHCINLEKARKICDVLNKHSNRLPNAQNFLIDITDSIVYILRTDKENALQKVGWYFQYSNLALLEIIVDETYGRDLELEDVTHVLILSTLGRLLKANDDTERKLPKIRAFLMSVVNNWVKTNTSLEHPDFDLPKESYKLLSDTVFNDMLMPNAQLSCIESMIQHTLDYRVFEFVKGLVEQIPEEDIKDKLYQDMLNIQIDSLFNTKFEINFQINIAQDAIVETDRFGKSIVHKINVLRNLPFLQPAHINQIINWSIRCFYDFAFKNLANVNLEIFQALNSAFFTPIITSLMDKSLVNSEALEEITDESSQLSINDFIEHIFDECFANLTDTNLAKASEKINLLDAIFTNSMICVDGENIPTPESVIKEHQERLELCKTSLKHERKREVKQPSPPPSPKFSGFVQPPKASPPVSPRKVDDASPIGLPKKEDVDAPVTVSESFAYFDAMKTSYETYIESKPQNDVRRLIYNSFNTQYGEAKTDQEKITAINRVLGNQDSVDALTQETHGERIVKAMKIILSILTAGLAAIPFAIHSHYKYGSGLFGHNRGAVFLKQCERFVDKMPTEEDSREVPTY